jgi:hypothetical protein
MRSRGLAGLGYDCTSVDLGDGSDDWEAARLGEWSGSSPTPACVRWNLEQTLSAPGRGL